MSAPRRISFPDWLAEHGEDERDYPATAALAEEIAGDPLAPREGAQRLIRHLRREIRRMPQLHQRAASEQLERALTEWRIGTGREAPKCAWANGYVRCPHLAVTLVRVRVRPDGPPASVGHWYCVEHAWRVLGYARTEGWPATSDPPLTEIGESDG